MNAIVAVLLACSSVQTPYDTVFDQVKNLAPRSDAAAPVRGLVLHRDVLELRFDSGAAYLLTPVSGRTIGVAIVGNGSVNFIPPLLVEQLNLRRVLGDSTINGPITAAVLIFTDSTAAELARSLRFGPPVPALGRGTADDAHGPVGDALDYLVDGRSHTADEALLTALLNNATTGYFSAYIKRARGESVLMTYDPSQAEEVSLYRRGKMIGQRTETVCQFERAEDLVNGVSVAAEDPEPLTLGNYAIDATIDGNYRFSAKVGERLIGRPGGTQQWADFYLYSELDVDSVMSGATPLAFYRRDHEPQLWIHFPKPVGPGDTVDVRVVYHGNLIGFGSAIEDFLPPWWDESRRDLGFLDSWAFIKSTSTWIPRYSFSQSAPVDLTFHTPKQYKFATIGRLVDSSTSGNVTTSHWVSEQPARNIAFNIGKFEQLDIRDPRIPPVTVHVNSDAHAAINRIIPSARNPADFVGADIANSLSFFTRMFGPPLFHQYTATETPYFHGEAFPGLIDLSWVTFLGLSSTGEDEIFRAHEMAHQWWGIGVEPAGYRDRWISEGFAEFSGMWYMQMILRDNDKYFKTLRDARQNIRRERGKSVPIGLGTRAGESWHGNYQLQTYQKGAWVLHMLRNMMIDTRTMSEDRFIAMMRDFYTTYRGKRATTLDFQHVVEKHFGQPMDWFFDEWVYGTDVPTYTFSWTATPDSTGNGYTAQMRVRQSDVPDNFGMYVPVLIKFDQGEAMIRMLVRGPTTEAKMHVPAQPTTMQLNPLESVLAEVKTEGWH
ncbi:MAG TPA: M1 family aminopeptidase [Gemmatimonadales bacterium]|jgi:hypothetical protein|nr:M1 family aminopeptidase [Gemmatimonadales bacterium]